MSEVILENLEKQLNQHLGQTVPFHAAYDINPALELAGIMENKGYSFQLKDLYPKSMTNTGWQAVFSKDGQRFSAEDPASPVAVCTAAISALTRQ
ncbi:MAG: hypothetical protein HUK40_21610 [Desulfobacter sp.]|nr:hypothetical protein [Desulfobacter sp.]WDP86017.1 MAG: hypothetical protein HUN05_13490 [Desulfobacter sp.]